MGFRIHFCGGNFQVVDNGTNNGQQKQESFSVFFNFLKASMLLFFASSFENKNNHGNLLLETKI